MNTRDNVKEITEIDLRISALQKIKQNSNNADGFNILIADLKKKKANLLAQN